MVRAKICGIRSESDLSIALTAGADAVGLISGVTHISEDALEPEEAGDLASRVPPYVSRVLVTHLEEADAILALAETIGADTIQVHGLVSLETTRAVFERARGRKITKAVHVTGPEALDAALELASVCDALHLDSRTADRLGGTGNTHDWDISRKIVEAAAARGLPVILAGGLDADNVANAVAQVRPYAVDVNSGVEDAEGNKDATKVAGFVSRSRGATSDAIAASA